MVDTNRLRYVHKDPSGTTTQDLFVFHLYDGQNQSPSQQFIISIKHVEKGISRLPEISDVLKYIFARICVFLESIPK